MKFIRGEFPLICLICVCVVTILFSYPGGMSQDSISQLTQARQLTFNDASPPSMAYIWHFLDLIAPGAFGLVLLNQSMIIVGTALLVGSNSRSRLEAVVIISVALLWPATFFIRTVAWTDVAMLSAFCLSLGLITTFFRKPELLADYWALAPLVFLIIVYGMSVRHNAAASALPIIYLVIWYQLRVWAWRRKVVMTLLFSLAVSFGIFFMIGRVNEAVVSVRTNFWQTLAIYDIAAISKQEDIDLIPTEVFPGANMAVIQRFYTTRSLGPLLQEAGVFPRIDDPEKLQMLRRSWAGAIIDHPFAYLRHRWRVFREVVGATTAEVWVPIYTEGVVDNELGIPNVQGLLSQKIRLKAAAFAETSLVFRVWPYLLISIAAIPLAFLTGNRDRPLTIALASSGLLNEVGLFFVAPSADYRYSLWSVYCGILLALLIARDILFPLIRRFQLCGLEQISLRSI